jgi:flagellar FliJ protein
MRKFKFTMQALYNVKTALEKQQKAELADANRRLHEFEIQLAQTLERVEFHRIEFERKVKEGISNTQLNVYGTGFRALREAVESIKEKIAVAEAEVERIQKKLIEIMQERKMLESLREKQIEEYKQECRMEEAKTLDDFIGAKAAMAKR